MIQDVFRQGPEVFRVQVTQGPFSEIPGIYPVEELGKIGPVLFQTADQGTKKLQGAGGRRTVDHDDKGIPLTELVHLLRQLDQPLLRRDQVLLAGLELQVLNCVKNGNRGQSYGHKENRYRVGCLEDLKFPEYPARKMALQGFSFSGDSNSICEGNWIILQRTANDPVDLLPFTSTRCDSQPYAPIRERALSIRFGALRAQSLRIRPAAPLKKSLALPTVSTPERDRPRASCSCPVLTANRAFFSSMRDSFLTLLKRKEGLHAKMKIRIQN